MPKRPRRRSELKMCNACQPAVRRANLMRLVILLLAFAAGQLDPTSSQGQIELDWLCVTYGPSWWVVIHAGFTGLVPDDFRDNSARGPLVQAAFQNAAASIMGTHASNITVLDVRSLESDLNATFNQGASITFAAFGSCRKLFHLGWYLTATPMWFDTLFRDGTETRGWDLVDSTIRSQTIQMTVWPDILLPVAPVPFDFTFPEASPPRLAPIINIAPWVRHLKLVITLSAVGYAAVQLATNVAQMLYCKK